MASNNNRTNKFVPEGRGGWTKTPVQQSKRVEKSSPKRTNNETEVLDYLEELFCQVLDKEIIYSVAENCGWNVTPAIEALIELSQDVDVPSNSHYSHRVEPFHDKQVQMTTRTRSSSSVETPTTARQHQIISAAMTAIKVSYQGYDEDSDDADIIVEEEEEFEVVENGDENVVQAVDLSPSWPGSNMTVGQNCCLREVKKVPRKCPILSAIEGHINNGTRTIVLMRGCPGSGKSYLARELVEKFVGAGCDPMLYIFSTDQYFSRSGHYVFSPENLPSAHEWNQKRVINKMEKRFSPIIVDNTNSRVWEMLPYAKSAVRFGYAIQLLEPSTPWCWKESELTRRNSHGVTRQTIRNMLDRYEKVTASQLISCSKMSYALGNVPPQPCSNPVVRETDKKFPREQSKAKSDKSIPIHTKLSTCTIEKHRDDVVHGVKERVTMPTSVKVMAGQSKQTNERSHTLGNDRKQLQSSLQSNNKDWQSMKQFNPQDRVYPQNIPFGNKVISSSHSVSKDVDVVANKTVKSLVCKETESNGEVSQVSPNETQEKNLLIPRTPNESEPQKIVNAATHSTIEATECNKKDSTVTHEQESSVVVPPVISDPTLEPETMLIDMEQTVPDAVGMDVCQKPEISIPVASNATEGEVKQQPRDEQLINDDTGNICREYVLMGPNNSLLYQKFHDDDIIDAMKDVSMQSLNQSESNNVDVLLCQDQTMSKDVTKTDEEQFICTGPSPDKVTQFESLPSMLDRALDVEEVDSEQDKPLVPDVINVEGLSTQNSEVLDTCGASNSVEMAISDSAMTPTSSDNVFKQTEHDNNDLKQGNVTQAKENVNIKIVESVSTEKVLPKLDLFSWFFSKKKVQPDSAEIKDDLPNHPTPKDNVQTFDTNQCRLSSQSPENLEGCTSSNELHKTWKLTSSWQRAESPNKTNSPDGPQDVYFPSDHSSSDITKESLTETLSTRLTESPLNTKMEIEELKAPISDENPTPDQLFGNTLDEQVTAFTPQNISTSDNLSSIHCDIADFSLISTPVKSDVIPSAQTNQQDITATVQLDLGSLSKDPQNFIEDVQEDSVTDLQIQNHLSSDELIPEVASEMASSVEALCHEFLGPTSLCDVLTSGKLKDQREKYAGAWSKMSPCNVLKDDDIPIKTNLIPEVAPKIPMIDSETNTSYSDFLLLEQDSSGDVQFVSGHNRSINDGRNSDVVRPVITISTLDKSSMTTPEDLDSGQPDFELLVNMFPKISREDLKELFEKCQGEMNWTVDLLLESGHAFEPSENLEIRFDNTDELKVTQQLLEELDMRDMRRSVEYDVGSPVTHGFDTSEPAVEPQVCPEEAGVSGVHQSTHSPSPSKKGNKKQTSELSLRLKKEMEKNIDLNDDSYSEHTLRLKKIRHGQPFTINNTDMTNSQTSEQIIGSVTDSDLQIGNAYSLSTQNPVVTEEESIEKDADMEIEEEEESIPLTLDSEFLTHIQTLFGETAFPHLEGVAPVVDVPLTLARQIHGLLMEAQQKQFDMQEKYFEDMIKDEEYARRLQEEEMSPPDFRQIMDMEIALELYKADITAVKKETKDDMATRLSKQKLVELFPTVEPNMLFDVFAAHGNSFQETLEVLEASTGEPEEAVRTVMSPEALLLYEKQLMDQAKQESTKQLQVDTDRANAACVSSMLTQHNLSRDQALADAKQYRAEANRQYQLRNQCYQKANDAMRNGQKAVASYYAQVGRLYKQYIEDANARAAASLLAAHTLSKTSTTLDLHFLFVVEAIHALDIFLDHHISKLNESGKSSQNLFVITGGGNHSIGGRPKIKPAVQRRLSQRGIKYYELNHGHLKAIITRHMPLSNGN